MSPRTESVGQYLHGAHDFRLESKPLVEPASDEVQVVPRSTSLCGSDLHYYNHYRNGSFVVQEPLCLGHESAGQIVALGSRVAHLNPTLAVGDRVALEVGIPCETCADCQNGRYNICKELRFRSSGSKFPHFQGTLQSSINHPVKWVHKLPEGLDYETGALLEPLAVAIHAVRRANSSRSHKLGNQRTCLIFGAGPVGLLCSVGAKADGFQKVIIADIDQGRLQFALENDFASTIYRVPLKRGQTIEEKLEIAKETAAEIAKLQWPDGNTVGQVDCVFECTGVESCIQSSVYATKSGGRVVFVGMGTPNCTMPVSEILAKEIDLIPTWRYANAYPRAIEIATKSVTGTTLPDIRRLVTHRYEGLESVPAAFQTAGKTKDGIGGLVMKTVVNFSTLKSSRH
ncbi:alcohol dehydrogenase [Talaromyces proteolyticus]|uniref:Alcohol dehydrogenase n=1 Tax=Talaromyces proteolyticus TaxID=1131652 RepID=A0AAD4KG77_9EURO|nr:alcohol dehydrogenase [Talaromyces proteolyticus]KAH8691364.1 alcohol dehydrogenase [Talaromyces proteolyticus]